MGDNAITNISLQDESGRSICSSDEKTVGLNDGRREILVWDHNPGNRNKIVVASLIRVEQNPAAEGTIAVHRQPPHL